MARTHYHLLFHRSTPWRSEIQGSTNIWARMFAQKGYRVSYMADIVHIGHVLTGKCHVKSWLNGARFNDGVWVFTPLSIVPQMGKGVFSLPWAADASYRSCVPGLPAIVRKSGYGPPDLIWTAKPGSSALKSIFPKARLIFHIVDYYPAFRRSHIGNIEKRDYVRSDHIFLIGHALYDYLVQELGIPEQKITVIGQGVFPNVYNADMPQPVELDGLPHPRAIWVGVVDKGDPEMFASVASHLERIGGSFIIIGPASAWAYSLADRFRNVRLLGPISPDRTPSYLVHCEIGVMLYDRRKQDVYKGQNPLKLYEYAAAGLAIISTPHNEYEYIRPPVIVVREPEEVPNAIGTAVMERDSWRQKGLRFAQLHSWWSKFEIAEKICLKLLETQDNTYVNDCRV